MDIEDLYHVFKGRSGKAAGMNNLYAVLVPVMEIEGALHILYQVRSQALKRQPGEVSFPGGKIEEGETPVRAALRETAEEMGIAEKNIEIIGELDQIVSVSMDVIYPYLGFIKGMKPEDIKFNQEVSEVFTVPIDFLRENKPYEHTLVLHADAQSFTAFKKAVNQEVKLREATYPVYAYQFKSHLIWGLTARITKNFIQELESKA